MKLEELGKDVNGNISSQNVILNGNNRGFRRRELKKRVWVYVGGYTYDSPWSERNAHSQWIATMKQIGICVGEYQAEGAISLYVLQKAPK